jgi:translocation and assembly module TamB
MRRFFSRSLFSLVSLLELLLVLALALLLAVWIWSGTRGSLATALGEAATYLPAGQTLEVQDVQGSVRQGGQIGLLRWKSGELTVSARDIRFDWAPLDMLQRRLHVTTLSVAELQVDDRRPASPNAPEPPPELVLPLDIDLPLSVGVFRLAGATALEASAITAHYRYEEQHHQLDVDQIRLAQGQYQGHVRLQARLPMVLDLHAKGKVRTSIGDGQDILLDASATVGGPLAGIAPLLDMQALIQPGPGNTGALANSRAMLGRVSARINPWAKQPVVQAQGTFSQLDLAALWPAAPRTLLTGNTRVQPVGPNWLAELDLVNRDAGPWDKGRVPVTSVKGLVEYGAGRWSVQSLNAEVAGGRIRLQANLAEAGILSATSGWQGQLQLLGVDLAKIQSTLDPVRLDGELKAVAAGDGVNFDLALQPAAEQARSSPLRGLGLQSVAATGRWSDGWLRLEKLNIHTREARLDGRIDVQPSTRAARGQLALTGPGMKASFEGELAALDGNGVLSLKLTDANAARQWLARLPMTPAELDTLDLQGGADMDLRWRGGWQALEPGRGASATVDGSLKITQLSIGNKGQPDEQALSIRAVDAKLSGTLDALALVASGTVNRGTTQAQLQIDASGGRDTRGDWRARIASLQIKARDSGLPGPWTVSLSQPLALSWSAPGLGIAGNPILRVDAAKASLTGPAPGTAELVWQAITWQAGGRTEFASKGELRGLPMDWLALMGDTNFAASGLRGDLVFDGQWDVSLAEKLSVRASLGRRSGDLRVQTGTTAGAGSNAETSTIDAGIRELQLAVVGDGDAINARFRWDSERAGNAQAELATRLTRTSAGWEWSPESAIKGSLRAQMPQVGVWSLLAPPGWRVRGTVDASLELSGTRSAPQWNGSLQASEMALRSVVDGVEFGNGQLRASLQGQRLSIDAFSLQGAGGKAGGELTATGVATWQAQQGNAGTSALGAIDLQIDAVAKALRVSARADRRLAVSGTLQAALRQSRLQIRGALKVDQALFILPDETAPSLGSDVVVLRRGEQSDNATANGAGTANAKKVTSRDSGAAQEGLTGDLLVKLDLGSDFHVRGRGIDTRVAGELELRSQLRPGEAPTVTGVLRTVGGQYKVYGQQLEIERGVMRFSGSYDNPSLDILAIRPKLTQRVGVQVSGNALLPRVRLYADPDLPEAEKLAWLVLGRSAANGGAEAAVLQQAAMALLGGQDSSRGIAGRLGLDELSVSGATDTGSTGASAATLTLGKRISQNFYVTYERSLAGTLGTFSIFYDLSERFTLRARTGEKSAVDLIFKISYE